MSPFWQPRKPLDWTIRCSRTRSTLLPGAHTWSADSPPPTTKRSGLQIMRGVLVVNLLQIESISKLTLKNIIGPDFYFIILEKPQRLSLLPPPSLSISLVDSTTTLPTSKASSGLAARTVHSLHYSVAPPGSANTSGGTHETSARTN